MISGQGPDPAGAVWRLSKRCYKADVCNHPDGDRFSHSEVASCVLADIPLGPQAGQTLLSPGFRLRAGMADMSAVRGPCTLRSSSADSAICRRLGAPNRRSRSRSAAAAASPRGPPAWEIRPAARTSQQRKRTDSRNTDGQTRENHDSSRGRRAALNNKNGNLQAPDRTVIAVLLRRGFGRGFAGRGRRGLGGGCRARGCRLRSGVR